MEIIQGIEDLSLENRQSAATIGNFDGVHLGHQHVIATLLKQAQELGVPSTVITFNPLAKEYFAPQSAFRIHTFDQRLRFLSRLGVERVLAVDFNESLSQMPAEEFIERVMIEGLGVQSLSVGDDFKFGKQRQGDFKLLSEYGQKHGFLVQAHNTFELDAERVSSGRIREALRRDDFAEAQRLLGRPYQLAGTVSRGEQRGREIGFPTANIVLDAHQFAVQGVYAVKAMLRDFRRLEGVANVGYRPTVNGSENRLEVHVFDFDEQIYGQFLEIEFLAKIREEMKFENLSDLQSQIKADVARAKQILNELDDQ